MYDFINLEMGSLLIWSLTTRRRDSNLLCSCSDFSIAAGSSFYFLDSSAIMYAPFNNLCIINKPRGASTLTVVSEMSWINA